MTNPTKILGFKTKCCIPNCNNLLLVTNEHLTGRLDMCKSCRFQILNK